jgi:hypothetical protein
MAKDIKTIVRETRRRHGLKKYFQSLPDAKVIDFPKVKVGALDTHINSAIENSGDVKDSLNMELGRTNYFKNGQQEGKLHSISEGRAIKRARESRRPEGY